MTCICGLENSMSLLLEIEQDALNLQFTKPMQYQNVIHRWLFP